MSAVLVELLLDVSVRVVVLAGLVAGVLTLLRVQGNGVLHAAWTTVLVAMLLMPVLPSLVPTVTVPVPAPARHIAAAAGRLAPEQPVAPTLLVLPRAPARPPMPDTPAPRQAPQRDVPWAFVVLVIYGIGVVFMLLRLVVGWRGARRLSRDSGRVVPEAARQHLSWWPSTARICESRHVTVPVAIGVIAPTVVLPLGWRYWPDAQLRAVVEHELAHVARHDPLVALLARLNVCVFWFHPLSWWLERRLAVTAEHACDEVAVRAIGDSGRYVEVLVEMAATVRRRGGRLRWYGVGMDGGRRLSDRIDHVLGGPVWPDASRIRKTAVAASCGMVILAVTACRLPSGERTSEETRQSVEWLIDLGSDTEVEVSQADRALAEDVLLAKLRDDPTGPWSVRLGRFYAASLIGHWVQFSEWGLPHEVTEVDPKSRFALGAREKLDESTDPVLLTAAAQFLVRSRRPGGSFTDAHLLARAYLERAVLLAPELVDARVELVSVVSHARRHTRWLSDLEVPPVSQYDAVMSLPESDRFELLPYAAIGAYVSARQVAHRKNPNQARYVHLKSENSRRFAEALLALSSDFLTHPEFGTAIYKAHMVLAALALRDGHTHIAVEHLGLASMAPPSDELMYGRRIASWWVVRDLVNAGEWAAVAEFLERMAETSVVDRILLLESASAVRSGQPPTQLMEGVHGAMP